MNTIKITVSSSSKQNQIYPAKKLLEEFNSPLDSETLFKALSLAKLIEHKTYLSSTGSGEIKKYWEFTDEGIEYGINQPTMSPIKTELRFYKIGFENVLMIAAEEILKQTRKLQSCLN